MKSFFCFLLPSLVFLSSCGNRSEIENLKKENTLLTQQIQALQQGKIPSTTKYILKLHLAQSHFSLSIKKHLKDYANGVDFEIPVDKEFFDSVKKGEKLVDKFRFGSLFLSGSFGDWELTIKDKTVK